MAKVIGKKTINVNLGELIIQGETGSVAIPLHSVLSMLSLYSYKMIVGKEVKTFPKTKEGWFGFGKLINQLYVDEFLDSTTLKPKLKNIKDLALKYGLKQVDIKRGLLIFNSASIDDWKDEKWAQKQPPTIVINKAQKQINYKVFKNVKKFDSPVLLNYLSAHPMPTKNENTPHHSFKNNPNFKAMYGEFDGIINNTDTLSDILAKTAAGKLPTGITPESIQSSLGKASAVLYNELKKQNVNMDSSTPGAKAVKSFCGLYYKDMNRFMKGYDKTPLKQIVSMCAGMDKAFKSAGFTLDPDMVLYRSQNILKEKLQAFDKGIVLGWDGWASFTTRFTMATGWMGAELSGVTKTTTSGHEITVLFVVRGFDKILSIFPAEVSPHSSEHEILANRGMAMKIIRRLNKESTYTYIYECEIVAENVDLLVEEKRKPIPPDVLNAIKAMEVLSKDPVVQEMQKKERADCNPDKWTEFLDLDDYGEI